jgi:RecG-like helicase/REP element-mobilizing transposase RayT
MPQAASIQLHTPLRDLEVIPSAIRAQLAREGLETAADLLQILPARHEDRRQIPFTGFHPDPNPVCHHLRILITRLLRFGRNAVFEATTVPANAPYSQHQLTLRWFGMPFMQKALAVDMNLIVYGKIKETKNRLLMDHPDYEVILEEDTDPTAPRIHTGRIVPIYRLRGNLKQKSLRTALWHLLQHLDSQNLPNLLPTPKTNGEFSGYTRSKAIRLLHAPPDLDTLTQARRYLALEEFYLLQLRLLRHRQLHRLQGGNRQQPVGNLLQTFLQNLPFNLTSAQLRCLNEIRQDMADPIPMNRLLHGDVGSGKTVVALAAMLVAVESGRQAALMAPTQILAEQHYQNALRWLTPLGLRVSLRTSDKKTDTAGAEFSEGSTRVPRVESGILPDASMAQNPRHSRRNLPRFDRPWTKCTLHYTTRDRQILTAEAREITLKAWLQFHHIRYNLMAVCVMPDHVHVLLEPLPKQTEPTTFWTLTEITHSIKSFSAKEINKTQNTEGPVWEKQCYDRMIRSEEDLQEKFLYLIHTPVRAGIVDLEANYPWTWPPHPDTSQAAKRDTQDACAPHEPLPDHLPHIIIGTHALLYDRTSLPKLGLAVIDEQHKFGVGQRARLIAQNETTPDVLVMTATPIPRTLTLTLYGDLDVSTIDERPCARGKIITAIRETNKLKDITAFLKTQLDEGRQAYIVHPLIEDSDKLDASAAISGHETWSKRLKKHTVGLLHGRIDSENKDLIMRQFRDNEIQALVSTTVIEVGVDVPNATVMIIHDAARFGLAQLHQLRGRIGRGSHTSYCILLIDKNDDEARQKLAILEQTSDGFQIAEEDLRRRGPGDLLGNMQSGQAPLRFHELLADTRLLTLARQLANRTLIQDPDLTQPDHALLRPFVLDSPPVHTTLQ